MAERINTWSALVCIRTLDRLIVYVPFSRKQALESYPIKCDFELFSHCRFKREYVHGDRESSISARGTRQSTGKQTGVTVRSMQIAIFLLRHVKRYCLCFMLPSMNLDGHSKRIDCSYFMQMLNPPSAPLQARKTCYNHKRRQMDMMCSQGPSLRPADLPACQGAPSSAGFVCARLL